MLHLLHEFKLTSNYVKKAIKEYIEVIFQHSGPMSLEICNSALFNTLQDKKIPLKEQNVFYFTVS